MANIVRKYKFTDGQVGYAGQMNEELDQLVAAINKEDDNTTALGTALGSSKVGSPKLSDLGQTLDSNVWEQLLLVATALVNRYTKAEIDTLLTSINTHAVSTIVFDEATGSFTITKIDGTSSVIDTNIEKIPASLTLENRGDSVFLVITNDDGTTSESNVTTLLNMYKAVDTATIDMIVEGYNISATLKSGSVLLSHLAAEVTTALESYTSAANASAVSANAAKDTAVAAAATATEKASIASTSASTATTKANEASTSASTATTKANEASTSETNASTSANNADAFATNSKSWAIGTTGTREGEDIDNAKYYAEQAQSIVAGEENMLKTTYDTNHSGIVDDAEKFGGQLPEYYAKEDDVFKKDGSVQMEGVIDVGGEFGTVLKGGNAGIYYNGDNSQKSFYLTSNCYLDSQEEPICWKYRSDGPARIFHCNANAPTPTYRYASSGVKDATISWTTIPLLTSETGLPLTGGTLSGNVAIVTETKRLQLMLENDYATLTSSSNGINSYWFRILNKNNLVNAFTFYDGYIGNAYKIYGEHNITASTSAPSSALAEGCQHQVY